MGFGTCREAMRHVSSSSMALSHRSNIAFATGLCASRQVVGMPGCSITGYRFPRTTLGAHSWNGSCPWGGRRPSSNLQKTSITACAGHRQDHSGGFLLLCLIERSQLDPDRLRSSTESPSRARFVLRSRMKSMRCLYASVHFQEQTYRWFDQASAGIVPFVQQTLDSAGSPLALVQASSSFARSLLERQNSSSLAGTSRCEMAMHLTDANCDL